MQSDRELLELAAKAAGLHIKGHQVDYNDTFTHLVVGAKFTKQKDKWNPLTDDGDALRLAVKLNMRIDHRTCSNTTYPFSVIAFPQKLEWAPKRTAELQLVSLMMPKGGFIGGLAEYCDEKYPKEPDDTTEYLDHYAATRRAVVRAAAEIGKQV